MRTSKNSMAIDQGPGPRSKSDEFSEVRMAIQMLGTILCLKPPNECCTFWDPESIAHYFWPFFSRTMVLGFKLEVLEALN